MPLNARTSDRFHVDEKVLHDLNHLDLAGKVFFDNSKASGTGSFSEVFKGKLRNDESSDAVVAVKRMRFHMQSMNCTKLFEQEIYVWAKFNHPNILPLLGFAFCSETSYPILVSKWMPNGSLWSFVTNNPEIEVEKLRTLTKDVANGLSYLHAKNVVHSDLKADNVLVSLEGNAMIGDFGCARMEAASRTLVELTSTVKGTPLFWAPELMSVGAPTRHSKETDVWAFGMTVYVSEQPCAALFSL